jgi:hypothetical protein
VTLASDDDREASVERLRRAYAEGRLTGPELAERVDGAYRARTTEELLAVERGLPVEAPSAAAPALPAGDAGYPPAQIAVAVIIPFLPFGDVVGLVMALALRSTAVVPERRRQLTWWAIGCAGLIVFKLAVLLLVLGA